MKFFVPYADDDAQAQQVYEATRAHTQDMTGWRVKDRKIYELEWFHNGKHYATRVGEIEGYENTIVLVILESEQTYFVCTANRGVLRGEPILVGRNEVRRVVDFE